MKHSFGYAKKLLKKYGWNSTFIFYFKKTFFVLFLIFLTVSIFIYCIFLNATEEKLKKFAKPVITQFETTINKIFFDVENYSLIISENSSTRYFLNCKNIYSPDTTLSVFTNNIKQMMNNNLISTNYLDSIFLYSFENNYILSTKYSNSKKEFFNLKWLDYYIKNNESTFMLNNTLNPIGGKPISVISCCSVIYDGALPIGIVVFNVKCDFIKNLAISSESTIENLTIENKNGEILYTLKDQKYQIKNNKFEKYNIFKEKYNVNFNVHNENHLYMSLNIGTDSKISTTVILIFFCCIALAIIMTAGISLCITLQFYKSIQEIIASLQIADDVPASKNENELLFIIENIKIKNSLNQDYKNKLITQISEIKRLQSYALQMQFSPHFLFNALNIANLMVMRITKGNTPANKILILLAELLEIALDSKQYIVNVEKELSYATKYLEIESIRDNAFDVEWDIPDSVLNIPIPKLILQPILENAFNHGIKYLYHEKRGIIRIIAICNNDTLQFKIYDNGKGMTNERLLFMRQQLKNNDIPGTKNIGLCNVNRRIKLIYGEEYGVDIESSNSSGTTIVISLPVTYN